MAIKSGVDIETTIYNTFRGADFSTDPSLVEKYRSPLCTNIVADNGGMPQKRLGWRTLQTFAGAAVHGLFGGVFAGETRFFVHAGTGLYRWTESGTPALLLSGLPEARSRGVCMGGKLWLVTGGGYYVCDGTAATKVTDAAPYVPTTIITRAAAGGGSAYESVNLLTPYRKNAFQTDGTARAFTLDSAVDAEGTVRAWVWGEETAAFTVDRENGVVTMTSAPAAPDAGSADGLVIQFPHTVAGYADMVNRCTILTTYGVGTNDRLVLSGNPDWPNRDWTSGLGDPTYIPDLSYSTVGSESTAILGYCRLGSALGIIKADNGQDSTVFLRTAETNSDGAAVFPLRQALAGVGAVAAGSFAALLDDPLFLAGTGITALASNTYTSERITQNRSFYLNARLTAESGLADAEAVIWQGMYLLALPNGHVYVLDGRQKKTYRSASMGDYVYEGYYWEHVPARCWLCWKDGAEERLYFGTADGRICRMNSDLATMAMYNDDDAAVEAVWATPYDDDGSPAWLKTMLKRGCCVTIKPYARSSGTVYFRTDRTEGTEKRAASALMDILSFADIDFERFTFSSDDSPKEIFFNKKVKNYKRLQIIIRNSEKSEGFGVYQITKRYIVGKCAKR